MAKSEYTLYVADCVKTGGIYQFGFTDGKLALKDKTEADSPMYLAIDNNRLYTILKAPYDNSDNSGIISYKIDSLGKLCEPSPIISTEGRVCCHLCVKDGVVFDANYTSGSINKLGEKTVTNTGKGTNPARQEQPHIHFTAFSPDNKYILACDLGLDRIFIFDYELNIISKASVPNGHGVRHLAFSQDGKTVYSANELESSISVFDYDNGFLKYITTVCGLPQGFVGANTAAAIRVSGEKLYVSHRGYDGIAVFDISGKIPKLASSFKSGGKSPRDFILTDDYIIVTNESGEVSVINRESFELIQTVMLSSPLCVVCKEGNNL